LPPPSFVVSCLLLLRLTLLKAVCTRSIL
jgi:hypothetical protein